MAFRIASDKVYRPGGNRLVEMKQKNRSKNTFDLRNVTFVLRPLNQLDINSRIDCEIESLEASSWSSRRTQIKTLASTRKSAIV
jgi:hypothetical protein